MIKRIFAKFGQTDKWQHVVVSCAIMLDCLLFYTVVFSAVATFGIGLAKEVWDEYCGSGFCWYDVFANSVGIAMAVGLRYLLLPIH